MATVAFRPVTPTVGGCTSGSLDRRQTHQDKSGRFRSRNSYDRSSFRIGDPRLEVGSGEEQQSALKGRLVAVAATAPFLCRKAFFTEPRSRCGTHGRCRSGEAMEFGR